MKPYLKKTHHKKVLVELLKVKALSSNPSPANKEKKNLFPCKQKYPRLYQCPNLHIASG
jgi:hypothetical protein